MKLSKQDYMRLPKERLAELLVERDDEVKEIEFAPNTTPYVPMPPIIVPYNPYTPWYRDVQYEITCQN